MITMTRKERKGDRSRSRLSMPREQIVPIYQDGMVVVTALHEASARRLERMGYRRVPAVELKVKPAAPVEATKPAAVDTEPALHDLGVKALRKLAADKGIKGRSKMDRDQLIQALS